MELSSHRHGTEGRLHPAARATAQLPAPGVVSQYPAQPFGEGRAVLTTYDQSAGFFPVLEDVRDSRSVGRHHRQTAGHRLDGSHRKTLVTRRKDVDIRSRQVPLNHGAIDDVLVHPMHARQLQTHYSSMQFIGIDPCAQQHKVCMGIITAEKLPGMTKHIQALAMQLYAPVPCDNSVMRWDPQF